MSSDQYKDLEKRTLEDLESLTLVVDKAKFIRGVNSLTALYHDALLTYEECRDKIGETHQATQAAFEQLQILGAIVSHFTDLISSNPQDLRNIKSLN